MTDGSFGGKRFGVFLYVKPGFFLGFFWVFFIFFINFVTI
jgi:hypothetical protein